MEPRTSMHVKSHAQELTHVPTKAKSNRRQHVHGKHECTLGRSTFQQSPYYNGNPNIGPRIIGNLDQSPDGVERVANPNKLAPTGNVADTLSPNHAIQ